MIAWGIVLMCISATVAFGLLMNLSEYSDSMFSDNSLSLLDYATFQMVVNIAILFFVFGALLVIIGYLRRMRKDFLSRMYITPPVQNNSPNPSANRVYYTPSGNREWTCLQCGRVNSKNGTLCICGNTFGENQNLKKTQRTQPKQAATSSNMTGSYQATTMVSSNEVSIPINYTDRSTMLKVEEKLIKHYQGQLQTEGSYSVKFKELGNDGEELIYDLIFNYPEDEVSASGEETEIERFIHIYVNTGIVSDQNVTSKYDEYSVAWSINE